MSDAADPVEHGLRAWASGDLEALEAVLDPQVTLRAVDPGPWDCTDRDHVMRLLRQRQGEGVGVHRVRVERIDERTFTVQSDKPVDADGPEPFPVATRVTVAGGKVVAMQQYRGG